METAETHRVAKGMWPNADIAKIEKADREDKEGNPLVVPSRHISMDGPQQAGNPLQEGVPE